jgi:outer membrane protein
MIKRITAIVLSILSSLAPIRAQEPIDPVRPSGAFLVRPYRAAQIPPIRLGNSGRLSALYRAGALYLTVQDAIALALENNIDIEISRYDPIASAWQLERAQAGGALPGIPSSASQAGSVASGQGVAGSQAAAGVSVTPTATTSSTVGNAQISQVGPVAQTLDPAFQEANVFSHTTAPQANIVQSVTPVLISNTRFYTGSIQQGFLSGGSVTASFSDHYLNENSPTDVLNPSSAPSLSLSFQHNLLQGFGIAVNARNITVNRINLSISDLNFKSQVIGTVVNVLNLYYALAADYEDVQSKRSTLEAAQKLLEDTRKQVEVGSLAPLDEATAGSAVASNQSDLVLSETSLRQHELQLKNLLGRTGIADPMLASARIVPLDRIVVPDRDDFPGFSEMVQKALGNRSDLAAEQLALKASAVSALGTRNGLLPTLQAFGATSQAGLSGAPKTVVLDGFVAQANPYFEGGIGNALGQVFRRDFPTENIGAFFRAPIGNHLAQADYGIDQLQLRQSKLTNLKDMNQAGVDVANYIVALRQSRARYDAAVKNRTLQERLLAEEQKRFAAGVSVPYNVIRQQRDLAASQSVEIAALVSYSTARIALDQVMGTTLETNHVSIEEARAGKAAAAPSAPPK